MLLPNLRMTLFWMHRHTITYFFLSWCYSYKSPHPRIFYRLGLADTLVSSSLGTAALKGASSCYSSDRDHIWRWDFLGANSSRSAEVISPCCVSWFFMCFMTSKQIQDDTSRDTLYRIHQSLIIRQMAKAVLVGASDWRKPFAVVGAAGFLVSILLFVLLKEPVVDAKVTEQRPENSKKLYCSCHNFRSETFLHLLPDRIICFQIDFCDDVQICGTGSSRWHKRI